MRQPKTVTLVIVFVLLVMSPIGTSQGAPIPSDYQGTVSIDGNPAADGTLVHATIQADGQTYTSPTVSVQGGSYDNLFAQPPSNDYLGKTITFFVQPGGAAAAIGATATYAEGLVDEPANLAFVSTSPGAIGDVVVRVGNQQLDLTWSVPLDGGSQVLDYKVYIDGALDSSVGITAATVTGLVNGQSYSVQVAARNAVGDGSLSSPQSGTPGGLPDKVANVAGAVGLNQVDLTWVAPSGNGQAIASYIVYRNGASVATAVTGLTYSATGLTTGQQYTFEISAVNALGEGPKSDALYRKPAAAPDAPSALAAQRSNSAVVLSWTAPASNGEAISFYQIYVDGVAGARPAGTTSTVAGLTNGQQYSFSISAINGIGEGQQSTAATATPGGVPNQVGGVQVLPGSATISITWGVAGGNGNSITQYTIYVDNLATATTSGTTFMLTGLTNGRAYAIQISAHNVVGEGPASVPAQATPATSPSAVGAIQATPGNQAIRLSWAAPNNGGAAITAYTIYRGPATAGTTTSLSHTVTGLTNGVEYWYTVSASNAQGEGPKSSAAAATPKAVPFPVTDLVAAPTSATVTLAWTSPGDGGSSIIDYRIYQDAERIVTTTSPSATVVGLVNGQTYVFTVTGTNANGESLPSNKALGTPSTVPGVVTTLGASTLATQATLTWSAPATGGSPITAYNIFQEGVQISGSATSPHAVTGLRSGTTISFTIQAVNANGNGPVSSPVRVTPGNPSAPASGSPSNSPIENGNLDAAPQDVLDALAILNTQLAGTTTVTFANGRAVVAWPAGAAVTGYQVWSSNSPYILIATLAAGQTTFEDVNAKLGTKYLVTAFLERDGQTYGRFANIAVGVVPGINELEGAGTSDSAAGNSAPAGSSLGTVLIVLGIIVGTVALFGGSVALIIIRTRRP